MDTSFEDLVMAVYNKSIRPPTSVCPDIIDYTTYLRQGSAGAIMRLARRETNYSKFSDVQDATHVFWEAGSIYVMSKSVCQLDSYEMSIKLQTSINSGTPLQQARVIATLIPYLFELSLRKHGNFVVQAAIAKSTPSQFAAIFRGFCGMFGELGKDHYGCWVVNSLIEKSNEVQRQIIYKELSIWLKSGGRLSQKLWFILDHKDISNKWH